MAHDRFTTEEVAGMLVLLMFLGLWVAVGVAVLLGWTPDSRDGDGWVSREESWRRTLAAPRRH